MHELNYSQKLDLERNDGVVLLTGENESGQDFYAYILMEKEQVEQMMRDADNGTEVDFTSYGEVILSGIGDILEEDIEYMEETYDFDHSVE